MSARLRAACENSYPDGSRTARSGIEFHNNDSNGRVRGGRDASCGGSGDTGVSKRMGQITAGERNNANHDDGVPKVRPSVRRAYTKCVLRSRLTREHEDKDIPPSALRMCITTKKSNIIERCVPLPITTTCVLCSRARGLLSPDRNVFLSVRFILFMTYPPFVVPVLLACLEWIRSSCAL